MSGDTNATVDLRWEIWDSALGWRASGASKAVTPAADEIQPDGPIPAVLPTFALPFDDQAGQAALYAERTITSGGAQRTLRSGPVLVTLFEEAP